jgi:hypothetical protein
MRTPLIALVLLAAAAAPALAQPQPRLGARTASPEAMVAQLNPASPEEEMSRLIAAADQHPLGSQENPIRVAGPDGERTYLAHLRCADGSPARVGARHEAGIGPYGSVTGAYDVTCAGVSGRLVFDMYEEEHREVRAPAGFTLAP